MVFFRNIVIITAIFVGAFLFFASIGGLLGYIFTNMSFKNAFQHPITTFFSLFIALTVVGMSFLED